jgi:hypothetical protein
VLWRGSRAVGVTGRLVDDLGKTRGRFTVRAKLVVCRPAPGTRPASSAGAACARASIGRGLHTHPNAKCVGVFDQRIDPWWHPPGVPRPPLPRRGHPDRLRSHPGPPRRRHAGARPENAEKMAPTTTCSRPRRSSRTTRRPHRHGARLRALHGADVERRRHRAPAPRRVAPPPSCSSPPARGRSTRPSPTCRRSTAPATSAASPRARACATRSSS